MREAGIRGLQVRSPFLHEGAENTLEFRITTLGFERIRFSCAVKSEGGAEAAEVLYFSQSDSTWNSVGEIHTLAEEYTLLQTDFPEEADFDDLAEARFRLRFHGGSASFEEADRVTFNHFLAEGRPLPDPCDPVSLPDCGDSLNLCIGAETAVNLPGEFSGEVLWYRVSPEGTDTLWGAGNGTGLLAYPESGIYSVTFEAVNDSEPPFCAPSAEASCTRYIAVGENTDPPSVMTTDVVLPLDENGTAVLLPETADDGTAAPCGIKALLLSRDEFDCGDIGFHELVLTAYDHADQSDSAVFNLEVIDDLSPVLLCNSAWVPDSIAPDGSVSLPDFEADGWVFVSDNCTNPVSDFVQEPPPGTVLTAGANQVEFTATDESGNQSTCTVAVNVQDILGTAAGRAGDVRLFPNPADDRITLAFEGSITVPVRYEIYGAGGLLAGAGDFENSSDARSVAVAHFAPGIYLIIFINDQGVVTGAMRFVKR